MRPTLPSLLFALAVPLGAQSNAIPGLDIRIYDVGSPTVYGRRGAAYPNGEMAMMVGHSMCNNGTVHIPWVGWVGGSSSGQMLDSYPKIAFLIARESGGRFVQVSNAKGHMKHSRVAFNLGSGPCGTCQSGPSQHFRIGCIDVYSTGFNGNQTNLGPTEEVDPWTGTWNPIGSYFDRGDPAVSGAAATDGFQSLNTSGWDAFRNRILIREAELAVPGAQFYAQAQVSIPAEPGTNRGNNAGSRQLNINWSGSSWSSSLVSGAVLEGSILKRWSGASISEGRNGLDDGHFVVGVRVTGPVDGLWHYEYAIHNQDNHRGGAAFRLPVCPEARVLNAGFRDLDTNPLNDWVFSRTGGELAFLGASGNALDWNTIYNVWFDSDAAPVAGDLLVDQARLGAGALTVAVPTQVPGRLGNVHLGAGCGAPAPTLVANGLPSVPNPGYALRVQAQPAALVVLAFAAQAAAVDLGSGCTVLADPNALLLLDNLLTDGSGIAVRPLPWAPGTLPFDFAVQAFELVDGGPMLGFLAASNGLLVRVGGLGCP
ncbi:MAG: hypothetical protein KF830_02415 [Planctomycetes bacterium]|nr:hypothetical protein [Planctomycetota bacterium]